MKRLMTNILNLPGVIVENQKQTGETRTYALTKNIIYVFSTIASL